MSFNIPSYPVQTASNPALAAEAAPGIVAGQDAQIATDKATAETAPATADAAKAQAEVSKGQSQDALLQRMVGPALYNPEVAKSPQWQQMVTKSLQERGLELPKGADGAPDLTALQSMIAPVVKGNLDPDSATKAMKLPPGPARDALLSMFNPASISQQMKDAPIVPDQKVIDQFFKDQDIAHANIAQGKETPQGYIDLLRRNQNLLPYTGRTFEQENTDPTALAGLAASTTASIQALVQKGVLSQAQAKLALAKTSEAPSITALNEARTRYLGVQAAGYDQRTQIMLNNSMANATKAQAYVGDVNQKIADAQNGSWTQRNELVTKNMGQTVSLLNAAQSDSRALHIAMQTALTAGTDPSVAPVTGGQSLTDAAAEADQRVVALKNIMSQMRSGVTTANAGSGLLNSVSGAGVSNTLDGSKPAADVSRLLHSASHPNLGMDPDTKMVYDTSASPPKYLYTAK